MGVMSQGRTALYFHYVCGHFEQVKEVRIPLTWGHLAGRWWGSEQRQPLLALHGWQDNAGTWDALVPHLPSDCSVLAIDFPGHGQSSWIPKGLHYAPTFNVNCIIEIKEHFKWEKINFLGHSMGSILAFTYASLYPDNVNFHIAVENIIPNVPGQIDHLYKALANNYVKLSIEQKHLQTEPQSYRYEDAVMSLHLQSNKEISLKSARFLVNRGTRKSKSDPTRFYFCHDPRLKYSLFDPLSEEYIHYGIQQLKFPLLYIKGTDSTDAIDKRAITSRELLEKTNDHYEIHFVPGAHHLHLNNPEKVAPIITQFLQTYMPNS